MVEMYHAKMYDETKERVKKGMSEDGHVKLLFPTIAFGLGIDIKDIDIVVWGSRNLLQMFQEVGRCAWGVARSGIAHIFLTGRITVKSKDPCISDIDEVVKSGKERCLHASILENFLLKGMQADSFKKLTSKGGNDANVIVPVSAIFVFVATIVKESESAPLLPKY